MGSLTPADEGYFDRAPQRFARTWTIAAPAAAVWAELVGERPLHWCRGLDIRWSSSPPFGVGATRQVAVLGLMNATELFFVWEEGRRHSFYFTEASLPVFTTVAEDYLVEPDGAQRCRFTWRVGLTPSAVGQPGRPLNTLLFRQFFRDTGRYFRAA